MSSKKLGRPVKVLNKTRINSEKFAGKASDLPVSNLPTYSRSFNSVTRVRKNYLMDRKLTLYQS